MRTTEWQEVINLLDSAECMWQDWQGFHRQPVPEQPPPTSILWGWRRAGDNVYAVRIRIDIDRIDTTTGTAIVQGMFHVDYETQPAAGGHPLAAWGGHGQTLAAASHATITGQPDPTRVAIHRVQPRTGTGSLAAFLWAESDPHPGTAAQVIS